MSERELRTLQMKEANKNTSGSKKTNITKKADTKSKSEDKSKSGEGTSNIKDDSDANEKKT